MLNLIQKPRLNLRMLNMRDAFLLVDVTLKLWYMVYVCLVLPHHSWTDVIVASAVTVRNCIVH